MDRAKVREVLNQFIGRKVTDNLVKDITSALKLAGLAEDVAIFPTGPDRLTVNVTQAQERQVFIVESIIPNVNV